MQLNTTYYNNNSRIVSGTPVIFQDDVILLCDTSLGPVTINLLEIPDNQWMTTYKLYVVDNSNNASVNNITINAGAGQFINNVPSITLSTNGDGCIVRILSNNKYNATISAYPLLTLNEGIPLTPTTKSMNFTGSGITATNVGDAVTVNVPGNPLETLDEGTPLTPTTQSINFTGSSITATAVGNNVTVNVSAVNSVQSSCACNTAPNNADIWAIVDVTSGPYNSWATGDTFAAQNMQTLASAVYSWFAQYQIDNPSFTGQLYMCTTFNEGYLSYLTQIRDYNLHLFLCDPSGGGPNICFIGSNGLATTAPANWGLNTWVAPTSMLLIPFINESNPAYHGGSIPPNLTSQPFPDFITDYNSFQVDLGAMSFFKSILYPANDGFGTSLNSLLNQFAVINNTDITLLGLQNQLGYNYTNYISSWTGVAVGPGSNPYASTQYYLGQYGWTGVLNKAVIGGLLNFTPAQFANDINTILNGGVLYCESIINNYDSNTGVLELRGLSSNTISINNDNGCLELETTLQTLDEGTILTPTTQSIDFTGSGVTASASGNNVTVNIPATVTSVGLTTGTAGTDINVTNSPITGSGLLNLNIPISSATNTGKLSSSDWTTFNNKQNAITLTTTGTSGPSTLVGSTLNIPQYASGVTQAYQTIQDEGNPLAQRSTINFVGAGVTATDSGTVTTVTIPGGGSGGYNTIQEEGANLPQRSTLDFRGAGVLAYDDPLNSKTIVDFTSASGYTTIQDEGVSLPQRSIMNFVGDGVTVADLITGVTRITIPSLVVNYANVIFVDGTNGNNITGTKNIFTKPFLTVSSAITTATTGDLVYIRRGDYPMNDQTLKDGVNIYCEPGVRLSGGFTDAGNTVVCSIYGYAKFWNTASNSLSVSGNGSNIYFQFDTIDTLADFGIIAGGDNTVNVNILAEGNSIKCGTPFRMKNGNKTIQLNIKNFISGRYANTIFLGPFSTLPFIGSVLINCPVIENTSDLATRCCIWMTQWLSNEKIPGQNYTITVNSDVIRQTNPVMVDTAPNIISSCIFWDGGDITVNGNLEGNSCLAVCNRGGGATPLTGSVVVNGNASSNIEVVSSNVKTANGNGWGNIIFKNGLLKTLGLGYSNSIIESGNIWNFIHMGVPGNIQVVNCTLYNQNTNGNIISHNIPNVTTDKNVYLYNCIASSQGASGFFATSVQPVKQIGFQNVRANKNLDTMITDPFTPGGFIFDTNFIIPTK